MCVSFGCSGSDCLSGVCNGEDCIALGCIGPNYENGVCKGDGCLTIGCIGSDCDHSDDDDDDSGELHGGGHGHGKHGHCVGPNCTGLGCAGPDCSDSNDSGGDDSGGDDAGKKSRNCPPSGCKGECHGPRCSKTTCFGIDCFDGSCVGPDCSHAETKRGGDDEAPADNTDDQCDTEQTTASSCDVVCQTAPTSTCTTDCAKTTGCSATGTTSTTTISNNAYFIPTPVYDPYVDDHVADQFVMSIVASVISAEAAVDAGQLITSSGSKASTVPPTAKSTAPSAPTATGATLCLASRHIGRDTGAIWSLFKPGMYNTSSTSVGSSNHVCGCTNDGITGEGCSAGAFTGHSDTICGLDGDSFKSVCAGATFYAVGSSEDCNLSITVDGKAWEGTTLSQDYDGPCSQSCPFPGGDALELRGTVSWSGPVCDTN